MNSQTLPALENSIEEEEEKVMLLLSKLANTTVFFILNHPLSGIRGSDDGEEVKEAAIAASVRV